MVRIPLANGGWFVVDDDDAARFSGRRWRKDKNGYAVATIGGRTVAVHRLLLRVPAGMMVDHANRDPLDNRRANLRAATASQNQANQKLRRDNRTGFKGVYWSNPDRRFIASLKVSGRSRRLGAFVDPREAARAYDRAALQHFGEFANLNFPSDVSSR